MGKEIHLMKNFLTFSALKEGFETMGKTEKGRQGVSVYYESQARALDVTIAGQEANLRRLEAQRNELNARVRALRDELSKLQEAGRCVWPRRRSFFALFCFLKKAVLSSRSSSIKLSSAKRERDDKKRDEPSLPCFFLVGGLTFLSLSQLRGRSGQGDGQRPSVGQGELGRQVRG